MTSEKPTEGPWVQGVSINGLTCVWLAGEREPIWQMGHDETWIDCNTEANARLVAEAGTVHHEVGLSPQELLDGYRELLSFVEGLGATQDAPAWVVQACGYMVRTAAINKHKQL